MKQLYKITFLLISVFILTYFQSYWSMFVYKDSISSTCIDCTFKEELTIMSVTTAIFIVLLYFVTTKIKIFKKFQNIILFISLVYQLSSINHSIFIDRHASWSTYTTGIWNYVIQESFLHILISSILFIIVLYLKEKMQFKKITLFIVSTFFLRLWIGVYSDAEFGENWLFVKHKPTLKWRFYSPLGMSDKTLKNLTTKQQKEEILYQEFIENN